MRTTSPSFLVALSCIMLVSACSKANPAHEFEVLMSEDAVDSEIFRLKEDIWQLSYTTSRTYPETALSESRLEKLAQMGWSKCEGSRTNWESYEDASSSNKDVVCVYQQIRYYVRAKEFLMLSFEYETSFQGLCAEVPSNNQQTVVAVFYESPEGSVLENRECSN